MDLTRYARYDVVIATLFFGRALRDQWNSASSEIIIVVVIIIILSFIALAPRR